LFGLWSQFFFTQPGDAEMLAEAFDCILSEGVADANRENRIDDTQGQVVDAVLFGLRVVDRLKLVLQWLTKIKISVLVIKKFRLELVNGGFRTHPSYWLK